MVVVWLQLTYEVNKLFKYDDNNNSNIIFKK